MTVVEHEDKTRVARKSERVERAARRQGQRGERGFAAVRALTAWLSRPLASFHLILALCGVLTAVGVVMVLSASSVESLDTTGSSVYALFKKHLLFVAVGAVLFWIGLRLPLRRLRQMSTVAMVVCLGMLALVLTPLGSTVNGSQGWFQFGSLSLQPVEVAKVALALWGAHILVTKYNLLHQWRHLLVPLVPAALLMFALVMAQPDFGATVTLGVVLMSLLWFAGAPKRLFGVIIAAGLVGVILLALIAQYRLDRVLSFLSPSEDTSGSAYQAQQAIYALADGGLFGKGLGQGPSKWKYLPNVHHDFIFSLIGEELGLIGCAVVIGLFGLLAVVGLRIAARNLDPWIRIVAGSLTVWLVIQAAINIGYVVGLLPVTGVTLPLISYGGTSLVVTMLLFGILANCARHEPEAVAALRTQGPGKFGWLLRLPAPDPYRPPARRKTNGRTSTSNRPQQAVRRSRPTAERRKGTPEYGRRSTPRTTSGRDATKRGSSSRRGHR